MTRAYDRALLIVDPTVVDYSTLLTGIAPASVLVLDPNQDGIEQITQALAKRPALESLQILSHGRAGALRLGNAELSLQNLSRYAAELTRWSQVLTGAEILLYGCEVAAGRIGQQFLAGLKWLTGAEIAASATPTGSAALGGDWNLEIATGRITAPMLIAAEAQAAIRIIGSASRRYLPGSNRS